MYTRHITTMIVQMIITLLTQLIFFISLIHFLPVNLSYKDINKKTRAIALIIPFT